MDFAVEVVGGSQLSQEGFRGTLGTLYVSRLLVYLEIDQV